MFLKALKQILFVNKQDLLLAIKCMKFMDDQVYVLYIGYVQLWLSKTTVHSF